MSSADVLPRSFGPYVLLAPLAQGGMGSVLIGAPRNTPDQLCLLKLLKPGLAREHDYLPRFIDEGKVAVALVHDNLCRVFDTGKVGDELFIAMELIEGVTFKRLLEIVEEHKHVLALDEAVALVVRMLRGLHAAHTALVPGSSIPLNVVHRDVSPHNAMIDVRGCVKVIDFGLATSVLKATFTESAVVLGKSGYMAPEQARGEDVGTAVDQYAAGIVLYELVMGERYYGDLPPRAIWTLAGSGNHRPSRWSALPAELAPVLARALAAQVDARFPSCAAFADALEAAVPECTRPDVCVGLGALIERADTEELRRIGGARATLDRLALAGTESASEATDPVRVRPSFHKAAGPLPASSDDHNTQSTRILELTAAASPVRPSSPRRRTLLAASLGVGALCSAALLVALGTRPLEAVPHDARTSTSDLPRATAPEEEPERAASRSHDVAPPLPPTGDAERAGAPAATASASRDSALDPAPEAALARRTATAKPPRSARPAGAAEAAAATAPPTPDDRGALVRRIARVQQAAQASDASTVCQPCAQAMRLVAEALDVPEGRARVARKLAECETKCSVAD